MSEKGPAKKRRIQNSCDSCKQKKIRCDSAQMPGNICSNCIAYSLECKHDQPVKKRGPRSGYVEQLENRVKKMERMLRQFHPDVNFSDELDELSQEKSSKPAVPAPGTLSSSVVASAHSPSTTEDSQDDDDLAHLELSEHLAKLDIDEVPKRFFGPSSGFMLMKNAMSVKDEFTGSDPLKKYNNRPQYWLMRPWEIAAAARWTPRYHFPDFDLLHTLVNIYFVRINPYYPVLHEPTTRAAIEKNALHFRDHQFGAVVLLICALASRYSDDPRVFVNGDTLSSGWQFYEQVPLVRKELFHVPSLYELQFYCLSSLYLHATSSPQAAWTVVGLGLRFSTELGIHRRKPEGYRMTVDDEMKKRAFWILVTTERAICSFMGRSCSIHDEDYDVELPVECDDEYWEISDTGEVQFRQPPGKPSSITAFNRQIELCDILANALQLYTIKKSKLRMGNVGEQWERQFVAQLDSRLNSWVDSIPDHLRWDPNREDLVFFTQSAILYSLYYNIQVQIHRPFIHKSSPLTFSSLAICANAARSCIHVLEPQVFRSGVVLPQTINVTFLSGVVLLLKIWGANRSGLSPPSTREWIDVEKCMRVLKASEDRWHISGRLWDMLNELSSVQDIPIVQPVPSRKREHDTDQPNQETFNFSTATHLRTNANSVWQSSYGVKTPYEPACFLTKDETTSDLFNPYNANDPVCSAAIHDSLLPGYESVDVSTLDMWLSAPVGFNLDDWGIYITNMGAMRMEEKID